MKTYNRNSKFDFGYYFGQTIEQVYSTNPWYISWCIEKVDFFTVTDLSQLNDDFNTNMESKYYDEVCVETELPNFLVFGDIQNFMGRLHSYNGGFVLSDKVKNINDLKLKLISIQSSCQNVQSQFESIDKINRCFFPENVNCNSLVPQQL